MVTSISHSADETFALGQAWGGTVQPGLVIGLCGDLGAGKTQLVKGLASGMNIQARVHSPTFSLVNVYPGGRLRLFHLDLYRLDTPEQIVAAGLEEYLSPDGVTVIEWANRWFGAMLSDRPGTAGLTTPASVSSSFPVPPIGLRRVQIEILGESERRISYEDFSS